MADIKYNINYISYLEPIIGALVYLPEEDNLTLSEKIQNYDIAVEFYNSIKSHDLKLISSATNLFNITASTPFSTATNSTQQDNSAQILTYGLISTIVNFNFPNIYQNYITTNGLTTPSDYYTCLSIVVGPSIFSNNIVFNAYLGFLGYELVKTKLENILNILSNYNNYLQSFPDYIVTLNNVNRLNSIINSNDKINSLLYEAQILLNLINIY